MSFRLPEYHHPDFTLLQFTNAPDVKWEEVEKDGVAPEYFHSTSMFPEYFKIDGKWVRRRHCLQNSGKTAPLPTGWGPHP